MRMSTTYTSRELASILGYAKPHAIPREYPFDVAPRGLPGHRGKPPKIYHHNELVKYMERVSTPLMLKHVEALRSYKMLKDAELAETAELVPSGDEPEGEVVEAGVFTTRLNDFLSLMEELEVKHKNNPVSLRQVAQLGRELLALRKDMRADAMAEGLLIQAADFLSLVDDIGKVIDTRLGASFVAWAVNQGIPAADVESVRASIYGDFKNAIDKSRSKIDGRKSNALTYAT